MSPRGQAGRTLLGRLSTSAALSSQGERLCTIGVAYLLEEEEMRHRFAAWLETVAGVPVDPELEWRAESVQGDLGRPDVEGLAGGVPMVRIEAKIGAPFGEGQLSSYAAGLIASPGVGVRLLVVLVPGREVPYAERTVQVQIPAANRPKSLRVVAVSWEDLFGALLPDGQRHSDAEQLEGLYRALAGQYVEPLTADEFTDWRTRESAFITYADLASRQLSPSSPLVNEGQHSLRYVCEPTPEGPACYSIGVRPPLPEERTTTPIWLRYHRRTKTFSLIRSRLTDSPYSGELSELGGHVWVPLVPLIGAPTDDVVADLVRQAVAINDTAHGRSRSTG